MIGIQGAFKGRPYPSHVHGNDGSANQQQPQRANNHHPFQGSDMLLRDHEMQERMGPWAVLLDFSALVVNRSLFGICGPKGHRKIA